MSGNSLKLQVLLAAIDRASGPAQAHHGRQHRHRQGPARHAGRTQAPGRRAARHHRFPQAGKPARHHRPPAGTGATRVAPAVRCGQCRRVAERRTDRGAARASGGRRQAARAGSASANRTGPIAQGAGSRWHQHHAPGRVRTRAPRRHRQGQPGDRGTAPPPGPVGRRAGEDAAHAVGRHEAGRARCRRGGRRLGRRASAWPRRCPPSRHRRTPRPSCAPR